MSVWDSDYDKSHIITRVITKIKNNNSSNVWHEITKVLGLIPERNPHFLLIPAIIFHHYVAMLTWALIFSGWVQSYLSGRMCVDGESSACNHQQSQDTVSTVLLSTQFSRTQQALSTVYRSSVGWSCSSSVCSHTPPWTLVLWTLMCSHVSASELAWVHILI